MLSLQFVGDPDSRHFDRKIPNVSSDEDSTIHLSGCQNISVQQLHLGAVPDIGSSRRNPRIYLNDVKRRYNLLYSVAILKLFARQNLGPDDPADPVSLIAEQFGLGFGLPVQPIDNNVGIKERIGQESKLFIRRAILAQRALIF